MSTTGNLMEDNKTVRLQIAQNENNEIVSIYSVPTGLACKCHLPDSDIHLVAKNSGKLPDTDLLPKQKIAHFARHDKKEIEGHELESVIHLLAKEVIKESKRINIPGINHQGMILLLPELVDFIDVKIEDTSILVKHRFKPDSVGLKSMDNNPQNKLLIEFCYSHPVDDNKKAKIRSSGISCVEVSLKGMHQLDKDGNPNRSGILKRLNNPAYTKWIYHSEEKELIDEWLREKEEEEEKERLIKAREREEAEQERLKRARKREIEEKKRLEKERRQFTHIKDEDKDQILLPLFKYQEDKKSLHVIRSKSNLDQKYISCWQKGSDVNLVECLDCINHLKIYSVEGLKYDYVICKYWPQVSS